MDDLDQKKLEAIESCFENVFLTDELGDSIGISDIDFYKKILSSLKQFDPEPLEVEIDDQNYVWFETYGFETKQEALAWCQKKGLKIK